MVLYRCSKKNGSPEDRINSLDELLEVFRGYLDSDTSSQEPLRFEFNKRYFVEVAHKNAEGVFLFCFHENHSFETLVPYDGAKTGFTIEEFLEDFWEHRVRQKYNFDDDPEIRKPSLTATMSIPWTVWFPLTFFALPFIFPFIDGRSLPEDIGLLVKMDAFIAIGTLPYWILVVQYITYSRGAVLKISQKEKLIILEKNSTETAIRFSEITKARFIQTEGKPLFGYWSYIRIEAGPKKRIIITDLMSEDLYRIVEMLGKIVEQEPSVYPLIQTRRKSDARILEDKNHFDTKAKELEEKWTSKTEEELRKIADSNEYADYAREAANRLLNRK